MLTSNPFSELAVSISPGAMQTYVILMLLLVIGGTIFDVIHKGSARYFFENMQRSKKRGKRTVEGGEIRRRERPGGNHLEYAGSR